MMKVGEAFASLLKTKERKLVAEANLANNYAITGCDIFGIVSNFDRPFLDEFIDFSEFANLLAYSTYWQFVYTLKFKRALEDDEKKKLCDDVRRQLAALYKMSLSDFSKLYSIKIIANNLFFTYRGKKQ